MPEQLAASSDPRLLGLAREVIAVVDRHAAGLTSRARPDLVGRQLAAGGLVRTRALLEGILLTIGGGRSDVAGVLLRTLYETYIVSLYVLLGGPEAVVQVGGEFARSASILAEKHARGLNPILALWNTFAREMKGTPGFPAQRLNYEEIAGTVGELLDKVGDPRGGRARGTEMYDVLYRVESRRSSHGGMGSIGPYVNWRADPWVLQPFPRTFRESADDIVVLAALLAAHLVARVFEEFGFRPDSAWDVYRQIDSLPAANPPIS